MIRWRIFKPLTEFTYILDTVKEKRMDDQIRGLKILSTFTYAMKTVEGDLMGLSDEA